MELSRQSPSGIKLSFHVVGWLIFFFAPVILSPGRDVEAYFSEAPIITSLLLRNILLIILFYANLFYFTPKLFGPKRQPIFFLVGEVCRTFGFTDPSLPYSHSHGPRSG